MVSKEKTRIFVSLTHDEVETLQIIALMNECTKSEVIQMLINKEMQSDKFIKKEQYVKDISDLHTRTLSKIEDIASCTKSDCNKSCYDCAYVKINKVFAPYLKREK